MLLGPLLMLNVVSVQYTQCFTKATPLFFDDIFAKFCTFFIEISRFVR